jgi:hypothetical protein
MTVDCEMLSEKMPAVAQGEASWTPAESAHLSACFACAGEWRLIQRAAHLGEGAAAGLDTAGLSASIMARVATRGRRDRFTRNAWYTGLAAAAAIALVVFTGRSGNRGEIGSVVDSGATPTVDLTFHLPLSELEALDSDQLQSVLDGLDSPVGEADPGLAPSFGDLDDTQLERVLRSLEG